MARKEVCELKTQPEVACKERYVNKHGTLLYGTKKTKPNKNSSLLNFGLFVEKFSVQVRFSKIKLKLERTYSFDFCISKNIFSTKFNETFLKFSHICLQHILRLTLEWKVWSYLQIFLQRKAKKNSNQFNFSEELKNKY